MTKKSIALVLVIVAGLAACDLFDSGVTENTIRLLIEISNRDGIAYEIYVNGVKESSIPDNYFGYFVVSLDYDNTFQLEIWNGGTLYDVLPIKPSEDAEKMPPEYSHSDKADYPFGKRKI